MKNMYNKIDSVNTQSKIITEKLIMLSIMLLYSSILNLPMKNRIIALSYHFDFFRNYVITNHPLCKKLLKIMAL